LPPLEDPLDLSSEGGDLRSEFTIVLRGIQEVEVLLPIRYSKGLGGPELILDGSGSFALLNPDL